MTRFGKHPDFDAVDLGAQAALTALADGDVAMSDMDVIGAGNLLGGPGGFGQMLQKQIGQTGVPVYNVQNACATGATALRTVITKPFETHVEAVNCHHNYVQRETHFGQDVFVTRKGAVSAEQGELGIIPGSMGAKSFIVRGKGNPESFNSCSHGAGRTMSRTKAKKLFTVEDQIKATEGVECRKDADVIDEIPMAYKNIDAVMAAQEDLVEVVYTLKQVVCVKG